MIQNVVNKLFLEFLEATYCRSLFFQMNFSPQGHLSAASPRLALGWASKESIFLHDVTIATVTATKTVNNIVAKQTTLTWR